MARPESRDLETLIEVRREAWRYGCQKPGRVPAADSPNRPALARLWLTAYLAAMRRRNLRTFMYAARSILVRNPTSFEALEAVIGWPTP
jgi:hypothetical protein